ncbi:hypothetical protein [Bacillus toyonensis]|uniref:hypothetical protein n=1 Tax=Bacillus toyonensis TaxID=155322 RepID=UPI002E1E436C|nr:hypothetical protein [Bacillus toyonensis]
MNAKAFGFYERLKESIIKADKEAYHTLIAERTEWITSYNEPDRNNVIIWLIEKDEELTKLLKELSEPLKEKIIQDDEFNRNRGTFKLYE